MPKKIIWEEHCRNQDAENQRLEQAMASGEGSNYPDWLMEGVAGGSALFGLSEATVVDADDMVITHEELRRKVGQAEWKQGQIRCFCLTTFCTAGNVWDVFSTGGDNTTSSSLANFTGTQVVKHFPW